LPNPSLHLDQRFPPDELDALRRAQLALQQREALLLDLAATIPGALFRLACDEHGLWRFVYMSPGVETLFEVSPQQACNDHRALRDCILPVDLQAHDDSIRTAIATGQGWEHEYRVRTASGRVKWIQARANRSRDLNGGEVWTGLLTDVSERKHMESVLRVSEETFRTLFETVPQGVVYQDAHGQITSANQAAQRILGLTMDQLQGRSSVDPHWEAVREDGSPFPGPEHPAMQALRTGQPVKDVVMGISVPGRDRTWLMVNATPIFKQGRLAQVYASFEDITQRIRLGNELQRQATTDDLTGVANRRSLMGRLASEFERVQRHPHLTCCLLALDLDLFKGVNDTWGHAAGDAVLLHAARLMGRATRQHDLVGRTGGEEFTIVLPDTSADEACALADRLRHSIAATPVPHAGVGISITVSIGVSLIAPGDTGIDAVLARADRALYQAKAQGRNQVRRLDPQSRTITRTLIG
jgi:diguanylate cyclase (GGDEF)-like protein/PAS domain S-box-containing protein